MWKRQIKISCPLSKEVIMNICCETFHAHIMIRLLVNKKNLITASNTNLWPEQYIPPKFSIRQQFINNVILPLTFRDTGGIVICRSLNYRANLKIKEKIFTHWKLQFVSSPQSTNLTALVCVGLPFTKSFQKLKTLEPSQSNRTLKR